MNNEAIEIFCPICGKIYMDCKNTRCPDCKFILKLNTCRAACSCGVNKNTIIRFLQSQVYQLQIENQSLINKYSPYRIKGE